jgi:hypothetical protein
MPRIAKKHGLPLNRQMSLATISADESGDRLQACGRAHLRSALHRHGLLLDAPTYNRARRSVEATGSIVLEELRAKLAARAGTRLERIYREPDYLRIVGFGAALTRYMTEPWTGQATAPAVAHIGACCNLIVSLFDHLVDAMAIPPADLLDPRTLAELARPSSRWHVVRARRRVPVTDAWLVLCLVAVYFDDLDQITRPGCDDALHRLLLQRIQRMHAAEARPAGPQEQRL